MLNLLIELSKELEYNSTTGEFRWSTPKSGRPTDRPAGFLSHNGYLQINYKGRRISGPKLAWFYMTGEWPTSLIGYKDNDSRNLAWDNLKLTSVQERVERFKSAGETLNKQKKEWDGQLVRPVKRARFTDNQVMQAVEDFIKNKTLVNGRYE